MILKTGKDFSDALIQLYETTATVTKNPHRQAKKTHKQINHRQINFKSKHFEYILDKLNAFLLNNNIDDNKIIKYEDFQVKYKNKDLPDSI
jgi:hypothetical protein